MNKNQYFAFALREAKIGFLLGMGSIRKSEMQVYNNYVHGFKYVACMKVGGPKMELEYCDVCEKQ